MINLLYFILACSDYELTPDKPDSTEESPVIEVSPGSILFSEVQSGSTVTENVTIRSVGSVTLNIVNIELDAGFNFEIIDAGPVSLAPEEESNFIVKWISEGVEDSDSIIITSNDPANSRVVVPINGTPAEEEIDSGDTGEVLSQPIAVCSVDPMEVEAIHGIADWMGSSSYDPSGGSIVNYDWSLISVPSGSPDSMPSGGANRRNFSPTMVGEYIGQLIVTSSTGLTSEPCYATLTAIPGGNLWIEMFWQNSGDDMDLHLVRPGGSLASSGDCYYANCTTGTLDWGVSGDRRDNPILDLDDIPGTGPENINIDSPANGLYTVYVHDYPGSVYNGRNDVTVNVYVGGFLEWTDTRNVNSEGYYAPFCEIDWISGSGSVTSL
jgi:hypothetical protein